MPKSAASAHMTTATLPLVAAALSFTAFLMTLNLYLPPSKRSPKDSSTTASEDLCTASALPEKALASLTRQLRALQRAVNTMPNTSTDTLLRDFLDLQGQLARARQAPRKPHSTPSRSPSALKRPTPPFIHPRKNPTPSTTHNLVPLQPRPQPHPGSRFFFGTGPRILLPSGVIEAPRSLQNSPFPLE